MSTGGQLAAGDGEVKAGKQLLFAEAFRKFLHHEDLVALKFALAELDGELLLLGGLLGVRQLFDALFHGKGALMQLVVAHERPEMHLLRSAGELLYLGLILFIFAHLLLEAALSFLKIEAVAAGVELRLAVNDLDTALRDAVDEPAVVAYREHGALEMQQVILEPLGSVQVKVVRRLVEKENVSVLKDEPREVDAGLFAAGEGVERLFAHGGGDVKTVCDAVSSCVHIVAAEAAEIVTQAVVLLQKRGGLVVLHEKPQLVEPVAYLVQTLVR